MRETNLQTKQFPHLDRAAEKLLEAAADYWREYQMTCGSAAVVWLTDTDGRLFVTTRGEYRDTLMRNIEQVQREQP